MPESYVREMWRLEWRNKETGLHFRLEKEWLQVLHIEDLHMEYHPVDGWCIMWGSEILAPNRKWDTWSDALKRLL